MISKRSHLLKQTRSFYLDSRVPIIGVFGIIVEGEGFKTLPKINNRGDQNNGGNDSKTFLVPI